MAGVDGRLDHRRIVVSTRGDVRVPDELTLAVADDDVRHPVGVDGEDGLLGERCDPVDVFRPSDESVCGAGDLDIQ